MNNLGGGEILIIGFVLILVLVGIFLLIRNIVLWYWKINKISSQLERQIEVLSEIREILKTK